MTEPLALKQGRQRYRLQREQEALERVRSYREWCRCSGDFRAMPAVPRNWMFKLARDRGVL